MVAHIPTMLPPRSLLLLLLFDAGQTDALNAGHYNHNIKNKNLSLPLQKADAVQTFPLVANSRRKYLPNINAKVVRTASSSPLFVDQSGNEGGDLAKGGSSLSTTAPWVRNLLIFGLGYGIGTAAAPGWQRQSRAMTRIGFTRIALALLIMKDVWRWIPTWLKQPYSNKITKLFSVAFKRTSEGTNPALQEDETDDAEVEDADDISDLSTFATKIQGVMNAAKAKLDEESISEDGFVAKNNKDDFDIKASVLALLQLLWQAKARRSDSRDQIYGTSGSPIPDGIIDNMDEMFELADLAYDEHPSGDDIKKVLKGMGYNLLKHDTTAVPGYLGHYIAINSDPSKGKSAIIGVKGTSNFEDFLTDMCASSVEYNLARPFYDGGSNTLRCHEGVFISSQRLADELLPIVKNLLLPTGYKITVVGHSLGAGCATLLAALLRSAIPSLQQESEDKLNAWAFASPPILDLKSSLGCSSFVTTVVNNADVVPRANISPLVVTVRLLRAVNKKLKERNLSMSNFQSTITFLNKIREGKDGEMIMSANEITSELDNALEKVELGDPDHLYVPGKVVVMYDLWENQQQREEEDEREESQKDVASVLADWAIRLKDSDVHSDTSKASDIPAAGEAVLCDGTCKALRFIELDGRLLDDHMAPQYRSSIANILSSRNSAQQH